MKKIFLLLFLLLSVIFAAAADKPAYTSEGKELGNVPAMPLVITTGLNGNPVKCGEKVTFTVIPATPHENAAKIRDDHHLYKPRLWGNIPNLR